MSEFKNKLEAFFIKIIDNYSPEKPIEARVVSIMVEYAKIPNPYTVKDNKSDHILMMMMLKNQMDNQNKENKTT